MSLYETESLEMMNKINIYIEELVDVRNTTHMPKDSEKRLNSVIGELELLKGEIYLRIERVAHDSSLAEVRKRVEALSTTYPIGNMKLPDIFKDEVLKILADNGDK